MSRSARRPSRRRTALLAGAVLGVSTLAGAATAEATPNVTDLEATVLRLGGAAVTGTSPIPSGRSLTPVRLTTSDPATAVGDGTSLNGAVPAVRTRRFTLPAVPAEQATFRIDGTTVATAVPDMRATLLQTDTGSLPAVVFTANGVTYAIPQVAPGAPTRTVASSAVNASTVSSLVTYQHGLLPVGARAQVGTAFVLDTFGDAVMGSGTARLTVQDADTLRDNAGAPAEELVLAGEPTSNFRSTQLVGGAATEVLATVSLRSGASVAVRGVTYRLDFAYGSARSTWLLDRAALAAAGATVADVTDVVSSAPTDHALSWTDLGLDAA